MKNLISCAYNMDNCCVELKFTDGSMIAIDTIAVENEVVDKKLFLLPLPASPFELAVWKVATVQYNYHISVERMNYSVPYQYIKHQVDVRLTRSTVEVFFSGTRIASHPRLHGRPNQYSTQEAHMPPDHQKYLQWNGERFIQWAEKIGENTAAVVRLFLTSRQVEQQGYRSLLPDSGFWA